MVTSSVPSLLAVRTSDDLHFTLCASLDFRRRRNFCPPFSPVTLILVSLSMRDEGGSTMIAGTVRFYAATGPRSTVCYGNTRRLCAGLSLNSTGLFSFRAAARRMVIDDRGQTAHRRRPRLG